MNRATKMMIEQVGDQVTTRVSCWDPATHQRQDISVTTGRHVTARLAIADYGHCHDLSKRAAGDHT